MPLFWLQLFSLVLRIGLFPGEYPLKVNEVPWYQTYSFVLQLLKSSMSVVHEGIGCSSLSPWRVHMCARPSGHFCGFNVIQIYAQFYFIYFFFFTGIESPQPFYLSVWCWRIQVMNLRTAVHFGRMPCSDVWQPGQQQENRKWRHSLAFCFSDILAPKAQILGQKVRTGRAQRNLSLGLSEIITPTL